MAVAEVTKPATNEKLDITVETPSYPRTILVAEDEHLVARNICSDLAELGYTVLGPAPNGKVALDLVTTSKPDVALLDIRMPVMDGLAAAEVLYREHGVPVVILSAYSDPPYLQAGVRVGVFGYLLKPVNRDELRVTLTVAWGRFLDARQLNGEVTDLKVKLEQRKIIEKAKGVLMKSRGLSEEDAMRAMQKQARDSRRPMVEIATALLATATLLDTADKSKTPPASPK